MSRRRYDTWKRLIDLVVAGLGLIVTAPLQAVIGLLVQRNLGSPVLFRQMRPGKDEELFELIKFRTMRDPDAAAGLVTDADRLTRFGLLLRSTSLDELPTLWNVLKGDMSLVGPRPLLLQYLDRYSPAQRRRHEVRPGITGLAQVSGRNALSWEAKFAYDLEYVDRRSLRLDARIMARTFLTTVRRSGIAADGEVTMSEFLGSGDRIECVTVDVAILGIGGQGRECLSIAEAMAAEGEDLRVVGFYDDAPTPENVERIRYSGYDLLGNFQDLLSHGGHVVCLGIGSGRIRGQLDAELQKRKIRSPMLVHPASTVGPGVELSEGAVIFAGARFTTNIHVGRHVHVNQNATIGHDSRLEDYATVNPQAAVSGDVSVGTEAMVGAGAVVLQGLRVGKRARIGASACVVEDVSAGVTVVGVPARPLTDR